MNYIKKGLKWCVTNPHTWAMLYLVFYLITFFTLDNVLKPKYIIYSPIDDLIPFCEYFILPYSTWFMVFPAALVYFMIKDKTEFQDLWFIMFTGMNLSFLINVLFPTGLDLRTDLPNRNICAALVNAIRAADDPVMVCPSIHCSSCSAIIIVAAKSKYLKGHLPLRITMIAMNALIIISTLFVKQHSIIDVFWGVGVSIILAIICYHTPWREGVKKTVLKPII